MRFSAQTVAIVAVWLVSWATGVDAFWRMPCMGRTGLARIDPIVQPGEAANHAHAIHGGNNFGMSSTGQDLVNSNCSSCAVQDDKSAYWVPALYFENYDNQQMEVVNQVGGSLIYYLFYSDPSDNGPINPFPPGFRVVAGDTNQRSDNVGSETSQKALALKGLGFNCLNYNAPAEDSLKYHHLRDKTFLDANCPQGVRFELTFPSCWNGKDLDSENHQDHVAYPDGSRSGVCPEGFRNRLISLFFETIWDTYAFKNKNGRFVISNGDPTGYGYHGDFMNGWDQDLLQRAVDDQTCSNVAGSGVIEDCPVLKPNLQNQAAQEQCKFDMPAELVNDDCKGPRGGLPGHVPISEGPAPAGAGGQKSNDKPKGSDNQGQGKDRKEEKAKQGNYDTSGASTQTGAASDGAKGAIFAQKNAVVEDSSSSVTTPPPSPTLAAPAYASTQYKTEGDKVYEIYVVNAEVTVTAGVTATETVNPTGGAAKHRRGRRHQHHGHAHDHRS